MEVTTDIIDRAVRAALKGAGIVPEAIDLALPAVKRDGITFDKAKRTLSGVKAAVAEFKGDKPGLFKGAYRDTGKTLEQIERERDKQMFGRSAAGMG